MGKSKLKATEIKIVTYTYSYTIAASGSAAIDNSDLKSSDPVFTSLGIATPTGYEVVGVMYVSTGSSDVVARNFGYPSDPSSNSNALKNFSTASRSGNYSIAVCFIKKY